MATRGKQRRWVKRGGGERWISGESVLIQCMREEADRRAERLEIGTRARQEQQDEELHERKLRQGRRNADRRRSRELARALRQKGGVK